VLLDEPGKDTIVEKTMGTILGAPASLRWEVGNAATASVKRRRLTEGRARRLMTGFESVTIRELTIDIKTAVDLGLLTPGATPAQSPFANVTGRAVSRRAAWTAASGAQQPRQLGLRARKVSLINSIGSQPIHDFVIRPPALQVMLELFCTRHPRRSVIEPAGYLRHPAGEDNSASTYGRYRRGQGSLRPVAVLVVDYRLLSSCVSWCTR